MSHSEAIDQRFEDLKVYVATSWSNLEIARRLDEIYQIVQPVGSLKNRFNHAHAVIEKTGSHRIISNRLEKLRLAVKEQTCLQSAP